MYKKLITGILSIWTLTLSAQTQDSTSHKNRLDFAKTYFEYGASYMPSFTGKHIQNGKIANVEQSASINESLTWGAFHFWGHTEFYATFPIKHTSLNENKQIDFQLLRSVTTGFRFYPWAMKEKVLRPYIGVNWGALDFKQKIKPEENQPNLSKDFMLNYEAGITYSHKNLGFRVGINLLPDNKWDYSLNKNTNSEINTPKYALQVGIIYSYDASKKEKKENINKWNNYPKVSKLSYDARRFGDFFIGIGPSISYSLKNSDFNKVKFPYLKQKLTSKNYFDVAIGYQFNKANLFTALSFRNPTYESEGYGSKQIIKKTSFALEVNKFLTDYTGFAPYIGLNLAYDNINYQEDINGIKRELKFKSTIEPGITVGWDIVPGKTNEALILRTNLRWYPMANFQIDGKKFNFNQLEYNLIQVVFYPERLKK